MGGPTHDLATCIRKGERWECLHAIDADHFWLGDLMVDLVQIKFEAEGLNQQAAKSQWWDVHERNRVTGNLKRIAHDLAAGRHKEKWAKWLGYAKRDLLDANRHGLHTGYQEEKTT